MTEPGAGSDAFGNMRTTARRDGDGFVLNGQKTFITNAPFADIEGLAGRFSEIPVAPVIVACGLRVPPKAAVAAARATAAVLRIVRKLFVMPAPSGNPVGSRVAPWYEKGS